VDTFNEFVDLGAGEETSPISIRSGVDDPDPEYRAWRPSGGRAKS